MWCLQGLLFLATCLVSGIAHQHGGPVHHHSNFSHEHNSPAHQHGGDDPWTSSFLPPVSSTLATGGDLGPPFPSPDLATCASACLANASCISFNYALGVVHPKRTCGIVGECYAPNASSCPSYLTLTCPGGTFTGVDFASYGEPVVGPNGECDFSLPPGACNSPTALSVFTTACVGKSTCTIDAQLSTFGGVDPCSGRYHFVAAKLSGVNCSSTPSPPSAALCTLSTYSSTYTLEPSANVSYFQRLLPRNDTFISPAIPYLINPPPSRTVTLVGVGLLSKGFNTNIQFLSNPERGTTDDLLFPYRHRHNPNTTPPGGIWGWDGFVPGSVASMILMGAGQALKWTEAPALRTQLNALIQGIAEAAEEDGFAVGYSKADTNSDFGGNNQLPSYVNSWFTHGMLDAADVNPAALAIARGMNTWWNNCTYLPQLFPQGGGVDGNKDNTTPHGYDPAHGYTSTEPFAHGHMLYWMNQAGIGHSRMAMSSQGTQADLDFLTNLFQEDWWLDMLAARNLTAVYARKWYPDNYEVCVFECYLDMYSLTGKGKYLDAVLGGWAMYRDPSQGWMFPGGSVALNENYLYPPGSLPLEFEGRWGVTSRPTGELCPSAFWVKLNQRLHRLYPQAEVYMGEIETTLINVALAGQGVGGVGVRYFARLHGVKEQPTNKGTCCEGQSTRIWGGVPELIFSLGERGVVFVNLFEPATLTTSSAGGLGVNVSISTGWPYDTRVDILVSCASPLTNPNDLSLNVRVPTWVDAASVPFSVDGVGGVFTGTPGTYAQPVPTQGYKAGVTNVSFHLPMALRAHPYGGVTQVPGFTRAAYTFGPFLLAAQGVWNATLNGLVLTGVEGGGALSPQDWLAPSTGALPANNTFGVSGVPTATFTPYFIIQDEKFTVYPMF